MILVNVIFRLLVVLVGVLIAFGIEPFNALSSPLHEIFGIVVILFGVYRLLTYFSILRGKKQ